jgi:hypothetical protein
MPYVRYVAHFRPTAICDSCGSKVRLRHYVAVLTTVMVAVSAFAISVALTHSRPLAIAGTVLGALLAFLADFWTFRNLMWDPEDDPSQEGSASA